MPRTTRFDRAQVAVLLALEPGGILSVAALALTLELSGRRARRAVKRLQRMGLVVAGGPGGHDGYQITLRGRDALSVGGRTTW
ncbi:helix-turn-helix domain-containing protein [Nocardia sp. CNY236]|uniref:MarR family transcriptional regulator n=1 Tax=Nocardia sp. CNY236 TaxID=1169152 RepID=UPI000415BD17|nr:helix-turn-helix domain-containing protein [Nocardia sp. CNY236]